MWRAFSNKDFLPPSLGAHRWRGGAFTGFHVCGTISIFGMYTITYEQRRGTNDMNGTLKMEPAATLVAEWKLK